MSYEQPEWDRLCGARYMAPLYDPAREKAQDARACIDQFEFPDIPCAYPVVWVRAREAAELCARRWASASATPTSGRAPAPGASQAPDYRFDLARGEAPVRRSSDARGSQRAHAASKSWSYGPAYQTGVCATSSQKTPACNGGGWAHCGSNTYPAGFFPGCDSPLGVYDQHGNAAEHMNLPLDESQMASRGSREPGRHGDEGELVRLRHYRAHEDWCRWRAPFWHGSRVMDADSHENYHLGFRCCKTIP